MRDETDDGLEWVQEPDGDWIELPGDAGWVLPTDDGVWYAQYLPVEEDDDE